MQNDGSTMTACGHQGQTCATLIHKADEAICITAGACARRTNSNTAIKTKDSTTGANTLLPKTSAGLP